MRTRSAATTMLLLWVTAACAGAPSTDGPPERAPVVVRVENHNPLLATVYVISSGEAYRIGQVETGEASSFSLPRTVNEFDLRIRIELVGSPQRFTSDPITAVRGDEIRVQVEGSLRLTTVSIR
jgi:hypothetical protein